MPTRAPVPVFPSAPAQYDVANEAQFRLAAERFMQEVAQYAADVSGLPLHASTHAGGSTDPINWSDLGQISFSGLASGDYVKYNGTNWINITLAQLLTDIKTVDGAASGLDADLLDGQHGSYYLDSANFTGTNWTDLTDGGGTTLHSHALDDITDLDASKTFTLGAHTLTLDGQVVVGSVGLTGLTGYELDVRDNSGAGMALQSDTAYVEFVVATLADTTGQWNGVGVMNWSTSTGRPYFYLWSMAGTQASPSATPAGRVLGSIMAGGWAPTAGYGATGAEIRFTNPSASAWANLDYPTEISFWTCADGSGTLTERLTIEHDGAITIGGNVTAASFIAGNATLATAALTHTGSDFTYTVDSTRKHIFKVGATEVFRVEPTQVYCEYTLNMNTADIYLGAGYSVRYTSDSDHAYIPYPAADQSLIRSAGNFVVQVDSDNNATTNYFEVRHNAATYSGGTSLFKVAEDGTISDSTGAFPVSNTILVRDRSVEVNDGSALTAKIAQVHVAATAPVAEDYPDGTIWCDTSAAATTSLNDLSDVTITSVADNEVLQYDSVSGKWINQTLAEAGISAVGHAHATTDITSGTFADARIAASNVTQHQAALTILESQITDGSILARLAASETVTGAWTFDNATRPTIDDGSTLTAKVAQVHVAATSPAAEDYPDGTIWCDTSAASATALGDLSDVTITAAAAGDILMHNGSAWVDATTLSGSYTLSGTNTHTGVNVFRRPSGTATELLVDSDGTNISAYVTISSSGGTGTPFLKFLGRPAVCAIVGDDSADHIYNFYSAFSSARTYDAKIRIFGSAASSWGTYLELLHDGTDGHINTDTGDLYLDPAGGNVVIDTASLDIQAGYSIRFDGTQATLTPDASAGGSVYDGIELATADAASAAPLAAVVISTAAASGDYPYGTIWCRY